MCSLLLLFKKGKECQAHFRRTVNTSKNCFNPSARLELPQNRMSETKLNEQFSSTKFVLPYILSLLSLSLPPSSSILINLLLLVLINLPSCAGERVFLCFSLFFSSDV